MLEKPTKTKHWHNETNKITKILKIITKNGEYIIYLIIKIQLMAPWDGQSRL